MNQFDEKIRAMAQKEKVMLPEGFRERMDQRLEQLPAQCGRKHRSVRVMLIAAIIVVMSAAAVLASPIGAKMLGGVIDFFNGTENAALSTQRKELEKFNGAVGVTVKDQGMALTIDNIAVDDNYIVVFYTVTSEHTLDISSRIEDVPEAWKIRWAAPHFRTEVDGKPLDVAAENEIDAYMVDAYTLKGMQRISYLENLKDVFQLTLRVDRMFQATGNWEASLEIDKSAVAVDCLTATPNLEAKVTTGQGEEERTHQIWIRRASISPFGNLIVLEEKLADAEEPPFHTFVLRDDKGRYLDRINTGITSCNGKAVNRFEFLGGSTRTKVLYLIPMDTDRSKEPKLTSLKLESAPKRLKQSQVGEISIDSIEKTARKIVVKYHGEGAAVPVDLTLLTADKKPLPFDFYVDEGTDYETNQRTVTFTFDEAVTQEEIDQIARVGCYTHEIKLREKEAVRIDLSK